MIARQHRQSITRSAGTAKLHLHTVHHSQQSIADVSAMLYRAMLHAVPHLYVTGHMIAVMLKQGSAEVFPTLRILTGFAPMPSEYFA